MTNALAGYPDSLTIFSDIVKGDADRILENIDDLRQPVIGENTYRHTQSCQGGIMIPPNYPESADASIQFFNADFNLEFFLRVPNARRREIRAELRKDGVTQWEMENVGTFQTHSITDNQCRLTVYCNFKNPEIIQYCIGGVWRILRASDSVFADKWQKKAIATFITGEKQTEPATKQPQSQCVIPGKLDSKSRHYDVFISYSSLDERIAEKIAALLNEVAPHLMLLLANSGVAMPESIALGTRVGFYAICRITEQPIVGFEM